MALKDQPEVRYALWQAYQRRCAICYEDLFDYSNLEIDHIIAESTKNNDVKLKNLIDTYELHNNFDLDGLENLRPTHSKCNNKKRNSESPREVTAQLLRIANNKVKDVKKHMKRFEDEAKYALNIESVRIHLKNGDINLEQYVDQINNYIADYGVEESKNKSRFSNEVMYKNKTIILQGYLPKLREPKGSCLLTFNSFYIRGTTINLDHGEILKNLYDGNQTPIEFGMRSYIIAEINDDNFIVQLGNSRFTLNKGELQNLCLVIDKFIAEYIAALKDIENILQANEFIPHQYDLTKYRLLKVRKELWASMLNFSRKNDYESNDTKWNIFDASGNNMLKIYFKEKSSTYNKGHKCIIHSFIEDSYSWEPSDYVWLVWWDINQGNEYNLREYWTVQQTYDWLTKEFLPYVIYDQFKPYKKSKLILKRKVSYAEFRKSHDITENYYNVEKKYYSIDQISNKDKLIGLLSEFNIFYSVIKDVFLQREDVIKLYNLILLSLEDNDHLDYHYLCSKLGINKTSNKEKIIEAIRNEIDNLTNDNTLKMSGFKLDILFRILYSNLKGISHNFQDNDLKRFLKYLEPYINNFNEYRLVESYSK